MLTLSKMDFLILLLGFVDAFVEGGWKLVLVLELLFKLLWKLAPLLGLLLTALLLLVAVVVGGS